jgi:formylglycine-generating enzyme required for sulfatase activity
MILVPATDFKMGSMVGPASEFPQHVVSTPEFFLDKTEVTVAQYRKCVTDGPCAPPLDLSVCSWSQEGSEGRPVDCVDWEQAAAFCKWRKKRLPTEVEWEAAAVGHSDGEYPWGAEAPRDQLCWSGDGPRNSSCPVDVGENGASATGVWHLAGNVAEWLADAYAPYEKTYEKKAGDAQKNEGRVVRGGSYFDSDPARVRARARFHLPQSARFQGIGFRCARPAPKKSTDGGGQ